MAFHCVVALDLHILREVNGVVVVAGSKGYQVTDWRDEMVGTEDPLDQAVRHMGPVQELEAHLDAPRSKNCF